VKKKKDLVVKWSLCGPRGIAWGPIFYEITYGNGQGHNTKAGFKMGWTR
jgi:hypothetical protein